LEDEMSPLPYGQSAEEYSIAVHKSKMTRLLGCLGWLIVIIVIVFVGILLFGGGEFLLHLLKPNSSYITPCYKLALAVIWQVI
jgi:hypothetical protein